MDIFSESLDFSVVRRELDTLYKAVHNKLEREWPKEMDSSGALPVLLRGFVLVSANTYHSVRYLCADFPRDPNRRPDYAISVPPLARTLVDTLFNIIFLFDNPSENIRWYWKSAWREYCEDLDRWRNRYGNDPEWSGWIAEMERMVEEFREPWFVEAEASYRDVSYWPHPAQMLKWKGLSPERQQFLRYVDDWFYKELSRSSHLSGPGLVARSFALFNYPQGSDREKSLALLKSSAVSTVVTLFLAVLSEIEGELRFSLAERMKYLWVVLSGYFEAADDLYRMRYSDLLTDLRGEDQEPTR